MRSRLYLVLNLLGSIILAILAWYEEQLGFLLLEPVWALVSACSLARVLRGRPPAARHSQIPSRRPAVSRSTASIAIPWRTRAIARSDGRAARGAYGDARPCHRGRARRRPTRSPAPRTPRRDPAAAAPARRSSSARARPHAAESMLAREASPRSPTRSASHRGRSPTPGAGSPAAGWCAAITLELGRRRDL